MLKYLFVLIITGICSPPVLAATFDDPEWPCIQRKVPDISMAQMWAGPEITDDIVKLGKSRDIAKLAARLALRRVTMKEAEQLIADFAANSTDNRNDRLAALFAKTFSHIASERKSVMAGIGRYAKKQSVLSDQIETQREKLATLKAQDPPDFDKIEEIEDFLAWDERIFRERRQSLTYVCESPVILEKRIFAIARIIQSHLVQ